LSVVVVVVAFCVYVVIVCELVDGEYMRRLWHSGWLCAVCNDCIFHYPVNAVGLHSEHSAG